VKQTINFLFLGTIINANGVREFQPRVGLCQPWDHDVKADRYPERVVFVSEPLQGLQSYGNFFVPGLPKLNPGLQLANTFGVGFGLLSSFLVAALPRCATFVFSVSLWRAKY
jgi:hypothetical protein